MEEQPMRATRSREPSPLASYCGKPFVVVGAGDGMNYIGRAVIELFEVKGSTDAHGLAWIADPAPGVEQVTLLNRIAAALPVRPTGCTTSCT